MIEAAFGWKQIARTFESLSGDLFEPSVVSAMDNVPADAADHRFPRSRHPFTHQLEAWEILAQPEPQSVLVTSGTGSGKTECFLVPILNDLSREAAQVGRLTGVRAFPVSLERTHQ